MQEGFLHELRPEDMVQLEAISQVRYLAKGEQLFTQGEPARGVFLLNRGRAKVIITTLRGRSVIGRIAKEGEVLGLSAVMLNQPFEGTAETLETSEVQFVTGRDFQRLLRKHENLSLRLMEQLSWELRSLYRCIALNSGDKTTRAKLARLLLDWASSETLRTSDDSYFHLGLTHKEISEMIGSSRETVCRILNDFDSTGLIRMRGSLVCLPDPSQLRALLV